MDQTKLEGAPFLGRGLSFPPTFNKTLKDIELVQGYVDVQQSLEIILSTRPGERVLQPDFGADLDQMLFETLDLSNLTFMEETIRIALIRHEPRIDVNSVLANLDDNNFGRVLIEVDYTVRSTNTRFNLVYPFYLEEGTDLPQLINN